MSIISHLVSDVTLPASLFRKNIVMKLLIFDVDGTLVQSVERADSKCFAATYEAIYGKPFPTIDWHQFPHVTDTTILQTVIRDHFGRKLRDEEKQTFEQKYMDLLRHKRREQPQHFTEVAGARALIHRVLSMPDALVAIATGGWRKTAHIKMQHVGIPSQAFWVSGADGKTTREAIIEESLEIAHRIEKRFSKIVYIGDAPWDVTTTRNMQLDFVGIRRRGDREVLAELGARYVLQNYLDQEAFLEALESAEPPK